MMKNRLLMTVYSLCTVRLMYTASILVCALPSALAKRREKSFNFCKVKNPMVQNSKHGSPCMNMAGK